MRPRAGGWLLVRLTQPPQLWVPEHHLRRRQRLRILGVQGLCHQHVSQDASKVAGHDSLLFQPAVVLKGQDNRIWGQLWAGVGG